MSAAMEQDPLPSTFPTLFAAVVARNGAKDAVVTPAETLSYDALERRSAKLACALLARVRDRRFLALGAIGSNLSLSQTFATTPGEINTFSFHLGSDGETPNVIT